MLHHPWRIVSALLLGMILAAAPAGLSAQAADEEEDDFVPQTDAPPGNRIGGASRTPGADDVGVILLAPAETIGLTAREQPVIYWYLSADTSAPIEVVITDPTSLENPVLETTLKGQKKRGIHKLDLSRVKQGSKPVTLRPGVRYELVVEVVTDAAQPSQNASAICKVVRVDPKDAPAAAAVKEKDPVARAAACGRAGLWFDYLDAINTAIDADSDNEALLRRRAKALAAQRLVWEADGRITEAPREPPADKE